ncbi:MULTISPECIES: medium chain dehydrogenase/reductase family protein [unclassified Streptomyces]|uniref:medium chain dehydrogenase/reductase family protein n=1 Tax=unclassified Streptomyces TaxID=2593676 RepID=UPI002E8232ED|nr:medium chain dehydrogenase/reductase family protein [Streptomyces sp. NBC_00589]WTI41530.1 medium chain dehydrogenase/reductase family protein [Streptomyces sp. NBC_00775]WUB24787.1 medium chain dehydrogenase/reductase family protein [Streptomyces sp. NBC_00589]
MDTETVADVVTEVVLPGVVEPSGLEIRVRPATQPTAGEVVLALEASGVSFAEQQMRRGKYYDQPPFPFVPGYDLVGVVVRVGAGVDASLVGRRFAALTKVGGWASRVVLPVTDLVEVPGTLDPGDAETVVVNGITAWQMLHRIARVRAGQTVLVHGANGGVGSTLVQLATHAGIRVIGTASPRHHDAVRALGATPVDYRAPDLPARVRELAPGGVDAVFDHVGGEGIVDSFGLLARGGTLVSYGSAATRDIAGSSKLPILKLIGRLLLWKFLPNGRRTHFYNIWAGKRRSAAFHERLRTDLGQVFALLADGAITAQVAARIPLGRAAEAMRLAESGTVTGKVILVPDPDRDAPHAP